MSSFARLIVCLFFVITSAACTSAEVVQDEIALEQDSTDPKLAKIVIVAGKFEGNAAHQYWAGSVMLAKLLRQTPGLHVSLVRGGWPKNTALFDNAKAIILFMEGGEGSAIHPLTETGRIDIIEKAVKSGTGLVTFHKGGAILGEPGIKMMELQGASYDFKKSSKGHWNVEFNKFPEHPITRGMVPFTLNDGYCIGLRFQPGVIESKALFPLLYAPKSSGKTTLTNESTTSPSDITCWAYDRPDGTRSFSFTGLHSHRYLELVSIRKLCLNGILWAAKQEIPVDGAKCDIDVADLDKNIEAKSPAAKK